MGSDAAFTILSKLQFLGFCADLKIPNAVASDPSEVFDAVLAAFLREAYSGEREARPLPAVLGDGRGVDLLRLLAAVRAAGGYAAVSSSTSAWAAGAESAGLDAALAAPVKLLYAKYLGALDRWNQRLLEAQGPVLDGDGRKKHELFFDANGRDKEEPFSDCNGKEQQLVVLKRKREDMVGMLDWVRGLAAKCPGRRYRGYWIGRWILLNGVGGAGGGDQEEGSPSKHEEWRTLARSFGNISNGLQVLPEYHHQCQN